MKGVNAVNAQISAHIVRLRVAATTLPHGLDAFDQANRLLFFPVFNQTYANTIDLIHRWARVDQHLTQS
jgi:hypothetical protein